MGSPPAWGGASGTIQLSRACGPYPNLPASQGFIGTGGSMFMPQSQVIFEQKGPLLGDQIEPHGYGTQFAPGQGGDTPGGGGSVKGETAAVRTNWINDGMVTPVALQHRPGSVGWVGSRRSRA